MPKPSEWRPPSCLQQESGISSPQSLTWQSPASMECSVSPSSFRLLLERLGSEYECLHRLSQRVAQENLALRGGSTSGSIDMPPILGTEQTLMPPEESPREIPNESATSEGIQDGVRQILTSPRDIMSKGMSTRGIAESEASLSGRSENRRSTSSVSQKIRTSTVSTTVVGLPKRLPGSNVVGFDEEEDDTVPIARNSVMTSMSSMNSSVACYSSEIAGRFAKTEEESEDRYSGIEQADDIMSDVTKQNSHLNTARLFPKWFDPGNPGSSRDSDPECLISDSPTGSKNTLLDFEDRSDCGMISPVSSRRLAWDFVGFMQLLVELWIVPFELVFLDKCETPEVFAYLSWQVTIFFSMDIVVNFCTGFVEGDREILQRGRIWRHYLRCWFWIDLAATVPWDVLLTSLLGGMFSAARLGKASKFIKTFRYLRMIRMVKLVKVSAQASDLTTHFQLFASVRHTLVGLKVLLALAVYAHVHGCIWAALQPGWSAADSLSIAWFRYLQSFWWAYTAITAGSIGDVGLTEPRLQNAGIYILEMIIASERLLFFVLASMKVSFQALRYVDAARSSHQRMDVLKYLRKHNVSFQTQIQVLFSLKDTARSQKLQGYFDNMAAELLPRELHRTICAELWKDKLLTLGLIDEVADWHVDFAIELAQSCREEVLPSKALLFKFGEPASFAYHIIQGSLRVDHAPDGRRVPDFRRGMWVGENALASSLLRRSATFTTVCVTSLMVVHGDSFREVLGRLLLMDRFQQFCGEQLWRGLCGRCGMLGDHFSDSCAGPSVTRLLTLRNGSRKRSLRFLEAPQNEFADSSMQPGTTSMRTAQRLSTTLTLDGPLIEPPPRATFRNTSRELQRFLAELEMSWIGHSLIELGVHDLSDLEMLDIERLRNQLKVQLTPEQESMLQPENIAKFRERQASNVQQTLFKSISKIQHLIFLSHYKVEAGTEAALLRTEIEQALSKDPANLGQHFQQPVFLDSEDLNNLEALQKAVTRTHNLVVLLTKNVLTRPWVLVEIATAWKEGTRLQPVTITKPGDEFTFPDADYYAGLREGTILDGPSKAVLAKYGFTEAELADSIQAMFQQIAVTYSPHKAGAIRQAEVDKLLKSCRLRSNAGGSRSSRTSGIERSYGSDASYGFTGRSTWIDRDRSSQWRTNPSARYHSTRRSLVRTNSSVR